MIPVVLPDEECPIFLVASVLSVKKQEELLKDLLVRVSVVALPTKVSVEVGRVRVPEPLVIEDITGAVEKVFTPLID